MADCVDITIATREKEYLWSFCANGKTRGYELLIRCLAWSKSRGQFIQCNLAASTDHPLPESHVFNTYRTQLYDTITRVLRVLLDNMQLFVVSIERI